jgi:hypothetical protein
MKKVVIASTLAFTFLALVAIQQLFLQQFLSYSQSESIVPKLIADKCLGKNYTGLDAINGTAKECIILNKINEELKNYPKEDRAIVIVWVDRNDTRWSGILDTGSSTARIAGRGDNKINLACERAANYSVVIQLNGFGRLELLVVQDGKLLQFGAASQKFGRVSVSGSCGART